MLLQWYISNIQSMYCAAHWGRFSNWYYLDSALKNLSQSVNKPIASAWKPLCIRVKWTATVQIRTPLSCPCPAGQTDTGQTYFWKSRQNPDTGQNRDRQNLDRQTDTGKHIWTKSGHRTDTRQNFPENPDKNRTRTGPRQFCPFNSAGK